MMKNVGRSLGRGGVRPGAGRPPGSKNQRSADVARQAAEAGITPIEVMLSAMRELWDEGTSEAKREAARIAKDAAPYIHPRLANIDQTIRESASYVARLPIPCHTADEWEAKVKADRHDANSQKVSDCLSVDIDGSAQRDR